MNIFHSEGSSAGSAGSPAPSPAAGGNADTGSQVGAVPPATAPASAGGGAPASKWSPKDALRNLLKDINAPSLPDDKTLTGKEMNSFAAAQKRYEAYNKFRDGLAGGLEKGLEYDFDGDKMSFLPGEQDFSLVQQTLDGLANSPLPDHNLILKATFHDRLVRDAYQRGLTKGRGSPAPAGAPDQSIVTKDTPPKSPVSKGQEQVDADLDEDFSMEALFRKSNPKDYEKLVNDAKNRD